MNTLGWTKDSGIELFNLDWLTDIDLPDTEVTGTFVSTFGNTLSVTFGDTFTATLDDA